jgi:hypothetical protein
MPPKPRELDWNLVFTVAQEVAENEKTPSRAKIANRLGWLESTLNKRARIEGKAEQLDQILHGSKPSEAGVFSAANDPTPSPWKAADVIRAHGENPDDVVIVRERANRWGPPEEPNHQLRVDWIPKADLIQPVDPGSWTPPPKPKTPRKDRERTVILTSDHHAPLVDKTLHKLTLDLLADEQPTEGLLMGDLMDFSTISRFRDKDGFAHGVQECLNGAFQILRDYREASPNTKWSMLPGNHDCRLHYAIQDNVRELHRIAPAGEELPSLSFRRLLHLDELGINLIDTDWEAAKFPLSKKLTARHGYTTAKNAGDKMLSSLTRSTVQGHSHRLSLTLRTEHDDDPDEPTSTRLAAEVGCMCEIHEGLGHAVDPNWQQGLMMVHIWPDGDFHLTPYFYVPGRLLGPGKRYA